MADAPVASNSLFSARCPACGVGALYKGLLKVHSTCGHCGYDLSRHESADGPAYFAIMLVSMQAVILGIVFHLAMHPPMWLLISALAVFVIGDTLLTVRLLKSALIKLHYKNNPRD